MLNVHFYSEPDNQPIDSIYMISEDFRNSSGPNHYVYPGQDLPLAYEENSKNH